MESSGQSTKSSSIKSEYDNNDFLNTFQQDLYPHQEQALEELNNNDKGIIASFCGTGKSRIMTEFLMQQFQEIDEDYPQHILTVFPSLLLLNQFYDKYIKVQEINTILICSGSKDKLSEEWFQQIQSLTLITYQSLNKIVKFKDYFTYVLFDEAHHICTKNRVDLIKKLSANCYYFTATPQQTKFLDMFQLDNEEQKDCLVEFSAGGIIFEYDFTDALEDQIVSDYQLIFRLYKDPNPLENKEQKQLQAILHMAQQHNRKRIIVFNQFINSSKFNKTNCQNFQLNNENIRVVSGITQKSKRQEIFSWFEDQSQDIKIICNVSCIKEGIDLPCTDMIVFCDEKQSKIQIIQALGRGTRKYEGKQDCIVSALIDYQQDIEELTHIEDEIIKNKFKSVTYICKALKNIDNRIKDVMRGNPSSLKFQIESDNYKQIDSNYIEITRQNLFKYADLEAIWLQKMTKCEEFKQSTNEYPSHGSKNADEKRLGQWLSSQKRALNGNGYKITEERRQRLDLYLADFKDNDQIWDETMTQCEQFKQSTNKYPSQMAKDKGKKHLGKWLSHQKDALKGKGYGKMTEERRQRLEAYLTDFKDNDQIWDETMTQCEQFKQSTNKYPREHSKDKYEKRLGQWLSDQKKALKGKGNRLKMTEERRQRLDLYLQNFYNKKTKTNKRTKTMQVKASIKQEQSEEETKTSKISNTRFEYKSLMSQLHQKYKTMNSRNLSELFGQNKQLWLEYHQISEQNEQGFANQDNLPYKRIVRYLSGMKFKRTKLILDLGCGMNRIKQSLENDARFQFISFDHIAVDETVQECDISNIPLEEDSVNICILCLALWGSNCLDYIKECYRVLEENGLLLIIEPTKRWTVLKEEQIQNRLADECQNLGFQVKLLDQDKFMFLELTKK